MLKKVSAVLCGVMLCASLAAATPIIEDVGNPASTEVNPKFFANAMEGMTQATSIYTVWNEQGAKQVVLVRRSSVQPKWLVLLSRHYLLYETALTKPTF